MILMVSIKFNFNNLPSKLSGGVGVAGEVNVLSAAEVDSEQVLLLSSHCVLFNDDPRVWLDDVALDVEAEGDEAEDDWSAELSLLERTKLPFTGLKVNLIMLFTYSL